MKIAEIFDSIQGEGLWMGRPVTFIRAAGCSLRCDFCDSKVTWAEGKVDMSIDDICKQVHYTHVIITGGEPTEQEHELRKLIDCLQKTNHVVGLESNGTYEHYTSLYCNHVVVSPKPKAMYCVFPSGVDELKYVVTEEFNPSVAIPESVRAKFAGRIWLQPCDYGEASKNHEMYAKAMAIAMSDERLRCGIQLHKIYGVQ